MLRLVRTQVGQLVCRSAHKSALGFVRVGVVAESWGCHQLAARRCFQCSASLLTAETPLSKQTLESHLGSLSTDDTVLHEKPLVIVVSGPSGVGKDAVLKSLRQTQPGLSFVVTATSREKRPGEVDGEDYLFVSKEQFEQWIEGDKMLEHAMVYGEYKGIPKMQVDEALAHGSDVVLRIDVQGARTVRRLVPDSVHIFLVAESEAAMAERLVSRKTEALEKLIVRVQTARSEFEHIRDFDYVIVNREGRLEETARQIANVIAAEKLKVGRATIPALTS